MRFICLGYADPEIFTSLSKEELESSMEEGFAYDDELRRGGHFAGGEALEEPKSAVTLRYGAKGVEVTDGPYMEAKESIGGYAIIQVPDLDAAIRVASGWPSPNSRIEIRPLVKEAND